MPLQYVPTSRRGISRVEVIVVLAIAALLGIMFVTSVQSARENSRKVQCLGRLTMISLSIQNYASSNDGLLPPLTRPKAMETGEGGSLLESWQIQLLPALDDTKLLKAIRQNAVVHSGKAPDAVYQIAPSEQVALEYMTCPTDPAASQTPGRTSFVINGGFISRSLFTGDPQRKHLPGSLSWDGNATVGEDKDIEIHVATGVTWHASKAFQPSLEYISQADGTSTTILVTENIQAGNWFDTDTTRISFTVPVANSKGQVPFGKGTVFESPQKPLNTQFNGGTLETALPQDWQMNRDLRAAIGTRPRPSSYHNGVNVRFCDGSGRVLNPKMDPHVYLKLITSDGVTHGEESLKAADYSW